MKDVHGKEMRGERLAWSRFVERLEESPAHGEKTDAPLVKLARFGNGRSDNGSLRHDRNVEAVSGLEGDYDDEEVGPEEAVRRLEAHGIRAVVATTFSHQPDAPRWRVFAPLSRPHPPAERRRLTATLNETLGGILNSESFALSQSYFVGGRVGGEYLVLPTFDDSFKGVCVDQLANLDELAERGDPGGEETEDRDEVEPTGATRITPRLDAELDGDGKAGTLWRDGKGDGDDRSRNDAALAGTLGALGFTNDEIEAALRAYPHGQIGDPDDPLPEHLAERQLGRLLGIAQGARPARTFDEFHANLADHRYIYVPTGEEWPAVSVDAALPKVGGRVRPSGWLDQHRAVDQKIWAPGRPQVIKDQLMGDGGWVKHRGKRCFNLYRPPVVEAGDPEDVEPWLELLKGVFPEDWEHVRAYLAHRVQRPEEKINHALVLGGAQGVGKDTILEPVKYAVGPWNFQDIAATQLVGRFNGFVKSVILRISEARDLGELNRYAFYEHL